MFVQEQERDADWWEVETLFDVCFTPGRTALSSYRLREGNDPIAPLCLMLRDYADDQEPTLAAAIRYWPVQVGEHSALLLGPIAVHPTHQGEGLGGLLIRESLAEARRLALSPRVLLIGDAPYYSRFGFTHLRGVSMPPPTNPKRILGYELTPGAWHGVSGVVRAATP